MSYDCTQSHVASSNQSAQKRGAAGFTLIEMAIVLVVLGLLLGGLIVPFSTQVEIRRVTETQRTLDLAREALIGYALAHGRLPCPASASSSGQESPLNTGLCTNAWNGFLPAVTLGVTPTDESGFAVDAWGSRIRYAVTTANTNGFTVPNQMKAIGITNLAPDLRVCGSATGISGTGGAATCTSVALVNDAVAVIYSLGKNYATGGTGTDEAANPNPNSPVNNRAFVSHTATPSGAPNGEFDDIVTWLSAGVLYSRLVAAGQL